MVYAMLEISRLKGCRNRYVYMGRMKLKTALQATLILLAFSGIAAADDNNAAQRATGTAQLMAGIVPAAGDPVIDRLAGLDCSKEQRQWMEAQWGQVRARLTAMEQWRG